MLLVVLIVVAVLVVMAFAAGLCRVAAIGDRQMERWIAEARGRTLR